MVTVKVIKQDGRTGLRLPGKIYKEYEPTAEKLHASGLVEILKPAAKKEEKVLIETKELKRKRK